MTAPPAGRRVMVLVGGQPGILLDSLTFALLERGFTTARLSGPSLPPTAEFNVVVALIEPRPEDWDAAHLEDAPVLVMSSEAWEQTVEDARAQGAYAVVGPRASLEDLEIAIRIVASGEVVLESEHLTVLWPQEPSEPSRARENQETD